MTRRLWPVALALVLAACARPSVSDLVLARVNGEPVTVQTLNESFTSSHQGHGVLLAGKGAVREFLESVIDKRLLIQEARRIGAEEDPAIQNMRATLRAKRAAEGFYAAEVTKKVRVTDEEIAAAHQRLGDRFSARHLLVESRPDAERALARVRAGEEFGDVARQMSRADTASRGGDLGIVQWGRIAQPIEDVLWTLKKGDLSEPFETEDGWNLLYVADRTTVELPKPESVRARLRANLEQRQSRARSTALLRELMTRPGGRVDEDPVVAALTAGGGDGPPGTTVVAEAAGESIPLERALRLVNPAAAKNLPPDKLRRQVRWLLEADVFKILLEKEGLARGYGDRPEVVQEVEKATDQALLEILLGKVVLAKVEIGDAEVQTYYRDHPKEFTEPEAVKLSAILVEKEDEAQGIVAALREGKDLKGLARSVSKDPTLAASGGEIAGWVTRGRLDPAVEDLAFSLKQGALGIAQGKSGHFVVRLDGRRPERLKTLDEVKEQARAGALRQRSRAEVKVWVRKLREASTIEIDDAAIDRAIAEYEATAREKAGKKATRQ